MSHAVSTPTRILCVDDRVSSLEVRRIMLNKLGYDALIASDPESALAIVNKVDVDLVVLDYSFPGQMNGEELAHRLKVKKPDLPLIMLSGFPEIPASARASVDCLILKGAGGPSELLNAIARLFPNSKPDAPMEDVQTRNQQLMEQSEKLVERAKNLTSEDKHPS